jgi:serine/threonine-protein kinase
MWVDHPKARARLVVEAMAAGRLAHPNVAAVVDVGETERGVPFLVMELAPGESLHAYLVRNRPLPVLEALDLARQLASGIAHAHGEGVIHRDLKPENVMILDGHVRIVDFGIAILAELGSRARFTTAGVVVGTPFYMAPEQLLGQEITERADLYALGVMIFELVAGVRPFAGTAVEVATQVVSQRAPSIAERAPGRVVPDEVEALCAALLERDADKRPASAAEVVATIDRVRAALGEVIEAVPERVSSRLAQPSSPPVNALAPTVETDRLVRPVRRWWHWLMPWR